MSSPSRQGVLLATVAAVIIASGCGMEKKTVDSSWIEYPEARRVDQVDTFHGIEVADPYRWLEDEKSDETQAWLAAQDAINERFFAQLPEHAEETEYLEANWIEGVIGFPETKGDNTFFWRSAEGRNHPVLFVQQGDAEPETVFDLNQNDPDRLSSIRPAANVSPKGRYVAYGIHHAGADAAETHIFDTETGVELDEVIPSSYATVTTWLPDESGFIYTWIDIPIMMGQETGKKPGIYRHTIGTPFEDDQFLYSRPWNGMFYAAGILADDEKNLLITDMNMMGSRGGWGVRPLKGGADTTVSWLIDPEPQYHFPFVASKGFEVFLVTDFEAPNWRIVAADITKPGIDNLREVVAESDEPISMMAGTNAGHVVLHEDRLYVTYIQHNAHVIRIVDLEGKVQGEIELPFLGTVNGIVASKDDPVLRIGLSSFLVPPSVYTYDTKTRKLAVEQAVELPAEFEDFEVTRDFYTSKDGTRIPMTIMKRKDTPIDGTAKVLLYGYGGWAIPWMPRFENWHHAWLHRGGIYAVANLRGGSEYGEAWHEAGMLFNKQNVFDDFAAAAEYLVSEGYTTHSRICIRGGSNGGLLTAASYNQRPELFGAVISQVAAVDLLRLPYTPVGATQTMELGAPHQSPEMFEYLYGYSPLHNVRHEGPYPPILHMVGENDPRCTPGHIYKYAAEMQQAGAPERIAILRVIRGAGHGLARHEDIIGRNADEIAFAWAMTE